MAQILGVEGVSMQALFLLPRIATATQARRAACTRAATVVHGCAWSTAACAARRRHGAIEAGALRRLR